MLGRRRGSEPDPPDLLSLNPLPDPDLRRDLREVIESLPTDEGGGASLLKIMVLGQLIVDARVSRLVEIGVYRGRLLLPLARLMSRLGHGEAVGIDPYSADAAVQRDADIPGIDLVEWPSTVDWDAIHRDVVSSIARWDLGGRVRLIRERSEDVAARFADQPIDMLHVDGNHDRDAVSRDVELFLPHMREGGLLVMDDTTWPSVRPVFEAMVSEHELLFSLADGGSQLFAGDMPNDFAVLRVRGIA